MVADVDRIQNITHRADCGVIRLGLEGGFGIVRSMKLTVDAQSVG